MNAFGVTSAAWYLGVSRQSIWRWRKALKLGGYFVGCRWQVLVGDLERFKRQAKVDQESDKPPTFRKLAAEVLNRSQRSLSRLERRLGKKLSPQTLAEILLDQGRERGRKEIFRELRLQKRLRYPKMRDAAKRRYSHQGLEGIQNEQLESS